MSSLRRNAESTGTARPHVSASPHGPAGPRGGDFRRFARWWWKEQTSSRIEDEVAHDRSRSTSRFILPLIAPILVVPAILLIREPDNHVAAGTLVAGAVALLYSILGSALERRVSNPFWVSLANAVVYSALISGLLWIFVVFDHPRAHVHWVIFFLYFLLVGTTGLSNEPRQSIWAGTFSILGYLTVLVLFHLELQDGGSEMARQLAPQFEWVSNSAKVALLLGATVLAAASSQRGRDLRRASLRDGLTGLLNRHAFDQCLEHLAQSAAQQGRSLTVAMIDIDHFKRLNDSYGHQAGDEVLRWVAGWLLRGFRATDLVARYGGEEFVVAFPDSDNDRILQRLSALQRGISEARARTTGDQELGVTISIGAARIPQDAASVYDVLALADDRLYQAKRLGRNRVVVADVEAPVDVPSGHPASPA